MELLIALAIGGIVMLGINSLWQSIVATNRNVRELADREAIRNAIRSRLDCPTTLARWAGQTTQNKILYDRNNRPISSTDATGAHLFGGGSAQFKVKVRSRDTSSGAFVIKIVDPTGAEIDLFKNVPMICK